MENWKAIPEWENWYEVSDFGTVRSITRQSIAGGAVATYQGKTLAACVSKNGYRMVTLSRPGKRKYLHVHRLVLLAFVGRCPESLEACHNNGIRTDNRLSNLRYDTRKANAADRKLHGTEHHGIRPKGEAAYNARLTADAVRYIRGHPEIPLKTLGTMFGVHLGTVHTVRSGKGWKHIA